MRRTLIDVCVVCVVMASLPLLAGCGQVTGSTPAQQQAAPPPLPVTVSKPVRREVMEWDVHSGRLAAVDVVEVRARISGFLDTVHFEEGALVEQGKLLYKIDPKPFRNALDAADAEVSRLSAQLEFDQNEVNRVEQLAAKGAATPKELSDARLLFQRSTAAKSGAEALQKTARLNLGYTEVTAPISGRIGRKLVSPGNLISGGAGGNQTTLLTTIVSINPIHCYVETDERTALKYQQFARDRLHENARNVRIPCWIELANETDFPHVGTIDFVNNAVDPDTGTMMVRAELGNPDGRMTPGLYARLRVAGSDRYPALLVPDPAVMTDQNLKYVFVIDAENKIQKKHIELGPMYRGMRVVATGLADADQVVINGQARARENMVVAPTLVDMPVPNGFMLEDSREKDAVMTKKAPATAPPVPPVPPEQRTPSLPVADDDQAKSPARPDATPEGQR